MRRHVRIEKRDEYKGDERTSPIKGFFSTELGEKKEGHKARSSERGILRKGNYFSSGISIGPVFLASRNSLSLTFDSQGIFNAMTAIDELELTVARKSKLQ